MKSDRKNLISPFHSLLGMILIFPIFGAKVVLFVPLLIVSSFYHYWMVAREDKIGIGEAFKEDLPDINVFHIFIFFLIFSPFWYPFFERKSLFIVAILIIVSFYHYWRVAKEEKITLLDSFRKDMPDINFFHIFMFFLILFPLWYSFVLANASKESSVNKDELLKVEFLKKKKEFFSKDLFYNLSIYNRKVEEVLTSIKKSETFDSYLKEIGYDVMVIPLDKFETINKKESFRKSSSVITRNNSIISEKRIYYSHTKIYISEGYLKSLQIRFKELKNILK